MQSNVSSFYLQNSLWIRRNYLIVHIFSTLASFFFFCQRNEKATSFVLFFSQSLLKWMRILHFEILLTKMLDAIENCKEIRSAIKFILAFPRLQNSL